MKKSTKCIALDVGERRIGVAAADSAIKLAYPVTTIDVDGTELQSISRLIKAESADMIVVGYPRNQAGEPTVQTAFVESFAASLAPLGVPVVFQDESLTSVLAEGYLAKRKQPYTKADIDAHAAAIILTDYLETHFA